MNRATKKQTLIKRWFCILFFMIVNANAYAYDCSTSYMPSWCENIAHTWNEGTYDAYIPLWVWHNRYAYDKDKIDIYNEQPTGFGFGKHYYDKEGDLHRLYVMGFLDSHKKIEPMAGYSYQRIFHPGDSDDWKFGLGYTLFVTARSDIAHYTPFPAVLPVWSVHYGRFSIEQTYIPGGHNNGNVLFTWLTFEL